MDEFIHYVEENVPKALETFLASRSLATNTMLVNEMAACSISSPKLTTMESNTSESAGASNKKQATRKTGIRTKISNENSEDVNRSYSNAIVTAGTDEVNTDQSEEHVHSSTKPPPIFVIGEKNLYYTAAYFAVYELDFSSVADVQDNIGVQLPDEHHFRQFKSCLLEQGLSYTGCTFSGELPEHIKELRTLRNAARRTYKRYPTEDCRVALRTLEKQVKRAVVSYKCEKWESYLATHTPQDNFVKDGIGMFNFLKSLCHMFGPPSDKKEDLEQENTI